MTSSQLSRAYCGPQCGGTSLHQTQLYTALTDYTMHVGLWIGLDVKAPQTAPRVVIPAEFATQTYNRARATGE